MAEAGDSVNAGAQQGLETDTPSPYFTFRSVASAKGSCMSILKRIAALPAALSLLLGAPLAAQEPAATAVEKKSGPALWKVADEDTTIYLFGTVHVLPQGIAWYDGEIAKALASADALVTEIITDDTTATKMQELVISKGLLPPDQTLRGLLTEEQRMVFDEGMTKLELPPTAFDRFEPWYASMMLSMLPLMKEGYSPESGVEVTLAGKADKSKPRQELETLEWQLGLFDSLPQADQIAFLMQTVAMIDQMKPTIDAMVAEWLEGDADALAKLMNESMDNPHLAEVLLYSRNRNWAQWIDTRLDSPGTIFIAVGAGHLAGANSVQDALKARGIETTRLQ